MQSENYQDGYSTRVRHVPIQVESRGPRGYQQRPSDDQINNQSGRLADDHSNLQNRGSSQNIHHNDLIYSPSDTSSINIDYKPPPPQRRPNTNNLTDENLIGNSSYDNSSSLSGHRNGDKGHSSREHVGQQSNRTARGSSRNRQHQPSNSPSPNSDKLVSSPEPIPLPPPPSDQNQQHNDNTNNHQQRQQQQPQKQKQQYGGGSISPDGRKGENPSSQMRDGCASPQQRSSENQGQQGQHCVTKDTSVMGTINSIKEEVTNLLLEITKFSGISAKSKEYRYIDEMLTRCILRLDNVECGDAVELRQHRKAAIQLVDRATDILQRKLQINSEIHDLSESMTVPS